MSLVDGVIAIIRNPVLTTVDVLFTIFLVLISFILVFLFSLIHLFIILSFSFQLLIWFDYDLTIITVQHSAIIMI